MLKLLGGRDCKDVQAKQFNVWRAVQLPMPVKWTSQHTLKQSESGCSLDDLWRGVDGQVQTN